MIESGHGMPKNNRLRSAMNKPTEITAISPVPLNDLGLSTVDSWCELKRHNGTVMGFNVKKASIAARLRACVRLLCYLSKASAIVGVSLLA